MTDLPSPQIPAKSHTDRLVIIWALVAMVLMIIVVWAAAQVNDPLSAYIHTDKMRHELAFGALGLCAAFMPTTAWRVRALAAVITFAMVVEIIQIPIPDRRASLADLFASGIGGLAGYGFGSAVTSGLSLLRSFTARRRPPAP